MSDVFISYASEDKAQAAALAQALADRGWSVWWDRSIPPGTDFDEVIQEALSAAKCIVVLWSRYSVASRWVRAEAEEGANRQILVPALIDDTIIPLGFRRIQAAPLTNWDGLATHPELGLVVERVSEILAGPPVPLPDDSSGRPTRLPRISPLLWMIIPTVAVALVTAVLMSWRIPTRIEVELATGRAQFTIGPAASQVLSITGPTAVTSLTVEKFATITFEAETLQTADAEASGLDLGTSTATAWRSVAVDGARVTLAAGEDRLNPAITFESAAGASEALGRLDALRAAPGSVVTLESQEGTPRLTLRVDGPRPGAVVAIPALFQIFADHVAMSGDSRALPQTGSGMLRARLRAQSPLVEVTGAPETLVLSFDVPRGNGDSPSLFAADGIPVTTLDFTALNDVGARVSAVRTEGHIAYPDYPDIAPVPIPARSFVGLGALEKFYVKEIRTAPTSGAMDFHLEGTAGHVMTSTGDVPKDHRLTGFDALWHSPRLALLFTIVVWVLPTAIGAGRLYNGMKGR